MNIVSVTLIVLLGYFLWHYVFKMYYRYWFYTRQGVPCVSFPLPVIGNQISFIRTVMKLDKRHARFPHIEYWHNCFGKKMPKMMIDFRTPNGTLIVNDPHIVNELYVGKNKFFDRHYRERQVGELMIGDAILFSKSTVQWAEKRKHIASIFYKDRINQMLNTIICLCNDSV